MGNMMPFSEDAMTIILGLGDPCEPGMHGPMQSPMPDKAAIDLITNIRDMCDDWLMKCGKCDEEKPDLPAGGDDAPDEGEQDV